MKNKWTKDSRHLTDCEHTNYRDCSIVRSQLQSGRYFYYVFHTENIYWAAPHSKMSGAYSSLQSAKRYVDYLLEREKDLSKDSSVHVARYDLETNIREYSRKLKILKSMYASDESIQHLCSRGISRGAKYLLKKEA